LRGSWLKIELDMPQHSVCPWWLGYLLASPLRRLVQDPAAILAPYLRPRMTILEPGPGMGFFTLEMARQVGPDGRVIAIDIQPKMLASLERRAVRAGLQDRVLARLAQPGSLGLAGLAGQVDFVLAFAVVHELPSAGTFFREAAEALRPGGRMLLAEPAGHVPQSQFDAEIDLAQRAGLQIVERPAVRRSRAVLLAKV
jgi:SAM-dependent methyltransferase